MRYEIDPNSPTWRCIEETLTKRLDDLRRMNDATELSPEKTAVLRGRIDAIKSILKLGVPVVLDQADE